MLNIALLEQDKYTINGLQHYFGQSSVRFDIHDSLSTLTTVLKSKSIDIVIMELFTKHDCFYDCVEFVHSFSLTYPEIKLVVFTQITSPALIGYIAKKTHICVLPKTASLGVLTHCVLPHKHEFSPLISAKEESAEAQNSAITPREWTILRYFAQGFQPATMATLLNISVKTISHHKRSLMNKMQCENLASFYRLLNIIKPPHSRGKQI